jgi:hypothetical protein
LEGDRWKKIVEEAKAVESREEEEENWSLTQREEHRLRVLER